MMACLERAAVVLLRQINGDYFTWNVKTGKRVVIPEALRSSYSWFYPLSDGKILVGFSSGPVFIADGATLEAQLGVTPK